MVSVRAIEPEQTHRIRQEILRPHQSLSEMDYPHDRDPTTVHFGSFADGEGEPHGIVTLLLNPVTEMHGSRVDAAWQLRGMATRSAARGTGAGKLLVQACFRHVQEHAHQERTIWCNARNSAMGFYEKLGFDVVSSEFDIPGIGPHHVMKWNSTPET